MSEAQLSPPRTINLPPFVFLMGPYIEMEKFASHLDGSIVRFNDPLFELLATLTSDTGTLQWDQVRRLQDTSQKGWPIVEDSIRRLRQAAIDIDPDILIICAHHRYGDEVERVIFIDPLFREEIEKFASFVGRNKCATIILGPLSIEPPRDSGKVVWLAVPEMEKRLEQLAKEFGES